MADQENKGLSPLAKYGIGFIVAFAVFMVLGWMWLDMQDDAPDASQAPAVVILTA